MHETSSGVGSGFAVAREYIRVAKLGFARANLARVVLEGVVLDMGRRRAEPFQLALRRLRQDLRNGVHAPGARLAASEISEVLGLSATPVREALSRLAGEGLLEDRRGQGFFVRPLSATDIADLFRLSLAQLAIALDQRRTPLPPMGLEGPLPPAEPAREPVEAVEWLFAQWVAEGAGRALALAHRALQAQLGPVRRIEGLVLRDLEAEAEGLMVLAPPGRRPDRFPALRVFHRRRISAAGRLAALLQAGAAPPNYSPDIV